MVYMTISQNVLASEASLGLASEASLSLASEASLGLASEASGPCMRERSERDLGVHKITS